MLGSHDTLSWNCIQNNQQYGFSVYSNSGKVVDLWLEHNEITNNDTYNYEVRYNGCGCSGGGKFWNVVNARVTNNWVLDNKSVGLWADTDNAGFEFVGNYIQNNEDVGLIHREGLHDGQRACRSGCRERAYRGRPGRAPSLSPYSGTGLPSIRSAANSRMIFSGY
jgi:hypothetical protein